MIGSAAKSAFREYGISAEWNRLSYDARINAWSFRAFGGISFDIDILRIDLTGLYDVKRGNFGVTLGARIQM